MPPSNIEAGPLKVVTAFGREIPFYALTFDKTGACTSPQSAEHLLAALGAGDATDVLVYCHGWNNDFQASSRLYDNFLLGVSGAQAAHRLLDASFRPVFVAIVWPSTALTFGAEDGPDIAADLDLAGADLLGELDEAGRQEAAAILAAPGGVDAAGAERLAEIVAPHLGAGAEREAAEPAPSPQDLLDSWRSGPNIGAAEKPEGFTRFRTADAAAPDARAASFLANLDPRWIVRVATVLLMKDRAGVVGSRGVADLVGSILAESDARLFLIGHSYGAKVVLSALAVRRPARPAEAVLLLQPAVSHLCFAANLGEGREGGFRRVFDRVRQPVHLSHSSRDLPLRRLFHLAVRRRADVGELQPLAGVSRYAALGGYGPDGCLPGECVRRMLPAPPIWPAPAGGAVRVVALDGSESISGHGDVGRTEIFWAMLNLLKTSAADGEPDPE